MKLKFESNLEHQQNAINSVVRLFEGITPKVGKFTISQSNTIFNDTSGFANQIVSSNLDEILAINLNQIQNDNLIAQISDISPKHKPYTFDIEMETGTGKTYVFLKTIFELNAKYGFTKFVIVVPSVAIREGVLKTLEITKEHFNQLYQNTPYDYFSYDSKSLSQIRDFSISNNIQIMIINIQSFDSDIKVFNQTREALSGESPINLIKQNKPIIIIDEPQTTSSSENSIEKINSLDPLFILRYSATFRPRKHEHLIYRLDAIDAYNKMLVKKIEVYGNEILNDFDSLGRVISTNAKRGEAKIEIHDKLGKLKQFIVKSGTDIYDLTNKHAHRQLLVDNINFVTNTVEFTNGQTINANITQNKQDDLEIKKEQIKTTIETHLNKQLRLKKLGIKVLSLFFIDEVKNYRTYDIDGKQQNGVYAEFFEQCFIKIASRTEYKELFDGQDINQLAKTIHNGYFSVDKNKRMINSKKGESAADKDTYSLIMKDKEKLLSFKEPLSFIFSHSALKEGWDNPNVFQVCTLTTSNSEIKKRQQIGRGLRLCVNQKGERIITPKYNVLSVIANESYKEFADALQKELRESGLVTKKITHESFVINNDNIEISVAESKKIYEVLKQKDFVDNDFVNEQCFEAINNNQLNFDFLNEEQNKYVLKVLQSRKEFIKIENARKKELNSLNKEVFLSEEFKQLWNEISRKTIYKVSFDSEEFIEKCKKKINDEMISFNNKNLIQTKTTIKYTKNVGVDKSHTKTQNIKHLQVHSVSSNEIKDVVNSLVNLHELKKSTIIRLICETSLLDKIAQIPDQVKMFLDKVIKCVKCSLMCDGIEYIPIDDYYEQSILTEFEEEIDITDKKVYLVKNEFKSKYPYKFIKCQSDVEHEFANDTIESEQILKFIKLPNKFIVDTPIGKYNPDWALINKHHNSVIAETKGTDLDEGIRITESQKIQCGKKHFKAINRDLYKVTHLKDLLIKMVEKSNK